VKEKRVRNTDGGSCIKLGSAAGKMVMVGWWDFEDQGVLVWKGFHEG